MKRLLGGIPWQNRTANRILGGFRYIHLTKGTFILNFDSTLPLFDSKNNSKLKIFEQKY
mgnify:CR=1 FL=1